MIAAPEKMRAWRNLMPPITQQKRDRVYLQFPATPRPPRDLHIEDAQGRSVLIEYERGRPCVAFTSDLPLTVTLDGIPYIVEDVVDTQ